MPKRIDERIDEVSLKVDKKFDEIKELVNDLKKDKQGSKVNRPQFNLEYLLYNKLVNVHFTSDVFSFKNWRIILITVFSLIMVTYFGLFFLDRQIHKTDITLLYGILGIYLIFKVIKFIKVMTYKKAISRKKFAKIDLYGVYLDSKLNDGWYDSKMRIYGIIIGHFVIVCCLIALFSNSMFELGRMETIYGVVLLFIYLLIIAFNILVKKFYEGYTLCEFKDENYHGVYDASINEAFDINYVQTLYNLDLNDFKIEK